MAFLSSLVLFCLCCFASDVVELEPVRASGKYDCDLLTQLNCNPNPYCHWNNTHCVDDPCLLVVAAGTGACNPVPLLQCGNSVSDPTPTTIATTQDCVGGSGLFCRSALSSTPASGYDYCFWAMLRDGSCPSTTCRQVSGDKKCIPSNTANCQALNSETDCKLVPKCLWYNSGCMADPCFDGSETMLCKDWVNPGHPNNAPGGGGTLQPGDCVEYKPYKNDGSGGVSLYCVYKDNKNPNLCYFLNGNNTATNADTDYNYSYPTYRTGHSPNCAAGTISGCDDHPSGLCTTKLNSKGGLAGQYCGDKDHGAASILHIPTLVVFLLASIFVSKLTL